MMNNRNETINDFFDAYAQRFNDALQGKEPDIEGTVAAFASSFVEASPAGIIAGANDENFRKAVPEGFAFYRSIGTVSMDIASREITMIDQYHRMVKIHWLARYRKKDGGEELIGFDVHYFVQILKDRIKIFAYVTGDEQKVLRERGLIPKE